MALQRKGRQVSKYTIYIAGPMSGLPDFNLPAFHAAEAQLRRILPDARILNPANNPPPQKREAPVGIAEAWRHYMRIALRQVTRADAVLYLTGWEQSEGAKLERTVAIKLGLHELALCSEGKLWRNLDGLQWVEVSA